MTFNALETSRQKGEPATLYLFRHGPGAADVDAYCDDVFPITHAGVTYNPAAIVRGAFNASGSPDKQLLGVTISKDATIAERFLYYPPSNRIILTIFQGHPIDADLEWIVAWTGVIISHRLEGNEVTLTGQSASASLKRVGLRRHYQIQCPHVLYGPRCGANKAAATITRAVTGVLANAFDLAPSWAPADRKVKYANGIAEWTTPAGTVERRTILNFPNPDQMLLSGPTTGLVVGASVALSLGCNHAVTDCADLHNNIHNYGGQNLIPTVNPIGIKNGFY